MYINKNTLDDILMHVFKKLLKSKISVTSSRGDSKEIFGTLLQLNNPLARLSRTEKRSTLFSSLGELLWYLSGTNELDFITYYIPKYAEESEDKKSIYGGYGPRLFNLDGVNQIENILELLKKKSQSRRAVIQIFDANDLKISRKEIPCTCTLQFIIRDNLLHMFTNMRSNDAYIGIPHDLFAFTMLQEIIARTLNVNLGIYKHAVGSLHLYLSNFKSARQYIDEGWQDIISMPEMPKGDPWPSITRVLDAERIIRNGQDIDIESLQIDPYWKDIVRLLKIFRNIKDGDLRSVAILKKHMHSDIYTNYIRKKEASKMEHTPKPEQLEILPNE